MTADTQTGLRPTLSSGTGRAISRMVTACKKAAQRPTPQWLTSAVVVGLSVIWIISWALGSGEHEARRWKSSVKPKETDDFRRFVNPPAGKDLVEESMLSKGPPDWRQPRLSVYSVPTVKTYHPRPTLRDLGDNGQAHAIDFITKQLASGQQSWTRLQEAMIDTSEASAGKKDPFQFERILIATVSKGANWDPGDRMVWTRAFIQPINFSLAGYTVAETENETVKVTSVEATKSRKVSADIALTIPGLEGPKASLGPSREQTVKTTSDIKAQYEKLGIDIMPNFLKIVRESETGGDVVGNTTVSLSVVTDPWMIRKNSLAESDKERNVREEKARADNEVRLLVTDVHLDEDSSSSQEKKQAPITVLPQAPIPHCPLKARVWMLYEQRKINLGREYYDESRQAVTLFRDVDKIREVEIVGADDVSPAVWSIQIIPKQRPADTVQTPKFLGARLENDAPFRELVFTDYGLATKAIHWIRTKSTGSAGRLKLNYLGDRVKGVERPSLIPVKRTLNECAENYDPNYRGIGYKRPEEK